MPMFKVPVVFTVEAKTGKDAWLAVEYPLSHSSIGEDDGTTVEEREEWAGIAGIVREFEFVGDPVEAPACVCDPATGIYNHGPNGCEGVKAQ